MSVQSAYFSCAPWLKKNKFHDLLCHGATGRLYRQLLLCELLKQCRVFSPQISAVYRRNNVNTARNCSRSCQQYVPRATKDKMCRINRQTSRRQIKLDPPHPTQPHIPPYILLPVDLQTCRLPCRSTPISGDAQYQKF